MRSTPPLVPPLQRHPALPPCRQENFFAEGVPYEKAMQTLIEAIAADVEFGKTTLETPDMLAFKSDAFFAREDAASS